LTLSLPWRNVGGAQVWLTSFLTLAQDGGEWLATRTGRFTPGKGPQCSSNRRLGGLQSQCGRFWRKVSWPFRDSNPDQTCLRIQYEVTSYLLLTKLFHFICGHTITVSCQPFSEASIYDYVHHSYCQYYLFHSECFTYCSTSNDRLIVFCNKTIMLRLLRNVNVFG
jgi:hypothetical protein